MQTFSAKVLDPTHLELTEPIGLQPGKLVQIAIPDEGEEESDWRQAAIEKFLCAYDGEDAIYDEL